MLNPVGMAGKAGSLYNSLQSRVSGHGKHVREWITACMVQGKAACMPRTGS